MKEVVVRGINVLTPGRKRKRKCGDLGKRVDKNQNLMFCQEFRRNERMKERRKKRLRGVGKSNMEQPGEGGRQLESFSLGL